MDGQSDRWFNSFKLQSDTQGHVGCSIVIIVTVLSNCKSFVLFYVLCRHLDHFILFMVNNNTSAF